MISANIETPSAAPIDENYRLHVLTSLGLLDTPPEAEFDELVDLAKRVLGCPIALVSLIDATRQWFKARCGLDLGETSRDVAFCAHAIRSNGVMVVPDATEDPRFRDNPLVTGAPRIRFYAGAPIFADLQDGRASVAIGTLCVIDTRPRLPTADELAELASLAKLGEALIRGRASVAKAVRFAEELNSATVGLASKNRQLAQAERMGGVGSWRWALDDDRLEWSDQVFTIYDLPVGKLPTLHGALEFFPPKARALMSATLAATMETGAPYDIEVDFVTAVGAHRRVRSIGELEVSDGKPIAVIGTFQDITQRHHAEQMLRQSAETDPLTRIANRAGFDRALDEAIARTRARQLPLAVMLIDLDGFKQVNDLHGHIAGDELLQGIARRLEMPYLRGCVAARLGGDEFALIVKRPSDCVAVEDLAKRVITALSRPVEIDGGQVAVGASIGICALPPEMTRRELIHRADMALYEAKRAGKGVARTWNNNAVYTGPERRVADRRA